MSKANVAVAGKKETFLLPLADLVMKYDVRKVLNEDRVLMFMETYESGGKVPPIEVVRGTLIVHDGRHRKAALEHLGRKHVECIFVEQQEFADQLMDAFGKNVSDAPFPPTRADVTYVMRQLLEAGEPHSAIQKRFEKYYQPSHTKKLLKDAHSNVLKARMQKALHSIAHHGASVEVAAKEYGVKPDTLREEVTGVKKKNRKVADVASVKSEISNRYNGNSQKTVSIFRDLFDKFEDGEISEKKVLEVLYHVKKLNTSAVSRIDSWVERFEVLKGGIKAKSTKV